MCLLDPKSTGVSKTEGLRELRLLSCLVWFLMFQFVPVFRYRGRRSRTRSVSRSPVGYRGRARGGHSMSPARSRSPASEKLRSHGARDSIRTEKRGSVSRSRSPSGSRSRSQSRSSHDTRSPKPVSKEQSRSPSSSSGGKKGLVSYGDVSPDFGGK